MNPMGKKFIKKVKKNLKEGYTTFIYFSAGFDRNQDEFIGRR